VTVLEPAKANRSSSIRAGLHWPRCWPSTNAHRRWSSATKHDCTMIPSGRCREGVCG